MPIQVSAMLSLCSVRCVLLSAAFFLSIALWGFADYAGFRYRQSRLSKLTNGCSKDQVLSVMGAPSTMSEDHTNGVWTVGSVSVSNSATLTITATVQTGGSKTNTATGGMPNASTTAILISMEIRISNG